VDGIGAEDVFFYGNKDENNPYNPQHYTIQFYQYFLDAGKIVLSVDYLTEQALIDTTIKQPSNMGTLLMQQFVNLTN